MIVELVWSDSKPVKPSSAAFGEYFVLQYVATPTMIWYSRSKIENNMTGMTQLSLASAG